ncbi:MAG: NADH-quinone oxidoreductase subunit M [Candidatus Schekmanbacteria bacterium]|nr:NADH-quinone oxidoreductase subunit M [Candidatus Schekmanbacteria bacterium]
MSPFSFQQQIGYPILSMIVFLPLLGILGMFFIPRHKEEIIRRYTFGVMFLDLILVVKLFAYFDSNTAQMQFVEQIPWIDLLGVSYHLGIDGISLLLLFLTTFLGTISVLSAWKAIKERVKDFMVCMLLLQVGVLGVFASLDLFLFYIFWEVMLIPMYFIIGIWGGERRLYSAIKFFIYTLSGSLVMILGILAIYFNYHEYALVNNITPAYSFNLLELYKIPIESHKQLWIFVCLFFGFAVKVPVFPLHTWLPDAHTEAPTAGSVILAGTLLKLGVYGFLRVSIPILPHASHQAVPVIMVLSVAGIIYGAKVAMAQTDMKKLIAYSSVSHLGFVTLGIFLFNQRGMEGGVLQMFNHGLSTGALFLLVGLLYERRHTRQISEFGGLSKQLPVFAVFYAVATFSSIGMPGLNGFIGEIFILIGAFQSNKIYAAFLVAGIVLGAAYMLWLFQRIMFGGLDNPENSQLADLSKREFATLIPIVILMFWIGLYPTPFLKIIHPAAENLLANYQAGQVVAVAGENTNRLQAPGVRLQAKKD